MACMEHSCAKCGDSQFNNSPRASTPCPKCGGRLFYGVFDETGQSNGGRYVNVHKCTICKKEQYNSSETANKNCDCGNNEFDSLIEDSESSIKTKVSIGF